MQLKYKEIATIYNTLELIMDKKLPLTVSHIITRNYKKLQECNEDFDKERVELAKKYARRDEDGNIKMQIVGDEQRYEIENYQAFNEEFEELANIEIEVQLDSFASNMLDTIDNNDKYDQLTPRELSALDFMITEVNE